LFRGRDLDSLGVGYYCYNLSDALEETLNRRIERFGDEQGFEAYYSCAVTPWLYTTPDLQLIDPPCRKHILGSAGPQDMGLGMTYVERALTAKSQHFSPLYVTKPQNSLVAREV